MNQQQGSREKNRLLGRQQFLILQLLNLAVFWFFADGVSASWLFINGCVNTFLYGSLLSSELRTSRVQIEPLVVFVASGLLRLGLGACWAAAAYGFGHYEALKFGPQHVEQFLMQGQLVLMVGDWALILGWTLWDHYVWRGRPLVEPPPVQRKLSSVALGVLAFGWFVKLLVVVGVPLFSLGNFVGLFVVFSSPAAIYLLYLNIRQLPPAKRQQGYLLLAPILLVELALSLSSYMKSAALVLIIAVGACISLELIDRHVRGKGLISFQLVTAGIVTAYFVLFILFPFSQIRRSSYWGVPGTGGYRITVPQALDQALAASIPGTRAFDKVHQFPRQGFWTFLARQSDASASSWVCQYVARSGPVNGMFVIDSLWNFIPRIVWPEKPPYAPGRKISVMNGFSRTAETATTSTAVGGIGPSAVLNYGYLAIFPSCLAVGIGFAVFSGLILRSVHTNPFATILYLSLLTVSAMHFESSIDCGLDLLVYWFVVYFPLLLITQQIFIKRSAKAVSIPQQLRGLAIK